MWWMDLVPNPGPWYEPDWEEQYVFGDPQPYRFPSRDNEHRFTLPAGFKPNPMPRPGEMFVKDGQPVGIIMTVNWDVNHGTSVDVQVSTY